MENITENEEVVVAKKKRYTEAVKRAVNKYRKKDSEKYNALQRNYYEEAKQDPEWKEKFNERCRINNQKYRDRKKEKQPPKPVGRPRKAVPKISINAINAISL